MAIPNPELLCDYPDCDKSLGGLGPTLSGLVWEAEQAGWWLRYDQRRWGRPGWIDHLCPEHRNEENRTDHQTASGPNQRRCKTCNSVGTGKYFVDTDWYCRGCVPKEPKRRVIE